MRYLYPGGDAAVWDGDIVGIFDLDNTSWSHLTRHFLSLAEKRGAIRNTAEDIPRSFILCADDTILLTQPSTATLVKRLETQEKSNV